jgi:hypothetical protein
MPRQRFGVAMPHGGSQTTVLIGAAIARQDGVTQMARPRG